MLDAGILVSVDRGEQTALSFRSAAERAGRELHTTAPVVSQVWRNGATQARLSQFLKTVTIHPFDEIDGRRVEGTLGRSGTADSTDAHLVLTAIYLGLDIITGDPQDIATVTTSLPTPRPTVHTWP